MPDSIANTARFQASLAAAREAWPGIAVDAAELASVIEGDPASLHIADLYLAVACARGDAAAIAMFETTFRAEIDAALGRLRLPPDQRDEIRQLVRIRLLVGDGAPAKIREYSGRGKLASWVRIVTIRTGLNALRGNKRHVSDDDILAKLPDASRDPDAQRLLDTTRTELAAAFRTAFGSLAPRERTLLRQHFLDGLTFKDLASAYDVHRVTASAWLKGARDRLFAALQVELGRRLGDDAQVSAVIALLGSRLDLSARSLLRTPTI